MTLHCQVAQSDFAAKYVATGLFKDINLCFEKACNKPYGKKCISGFCNQDIHFLFVVQEIYTLGIWEYAMTAR